MASPTEPTHGKLGALYLLFPNGFVGAGLNDLSWGTGYNGGASAIFEVEIDAADTPDTFKWRKDGGAWTEDVAITGEAQTLSDTQTITFAATTGHTLGDKWLIGNLVAEGTTESAAQAQITEATRRRINPNAPPVWTDSGGAPLQIVDYVNGKGYFGANVATVTVAGNNGFIPEGALRQVGYLIDCALNISLDMADNTSQGDHWKSALPGQAGGSGSASAYFIAAQTLFDLINEGLVGDNYFLIEFFTYDPDQDQTGDHFYCWATFSGWGVANKINEVVKENISFQIDGILSFVSQD